MAINKVEANGGTLIDLTNDTVQASDVLKGKTLHLASGVQVEGTYDHDNKQDTFVNLWEAEGGSEGINNLDIDALSDLIDNYSALIVTISNENDDAETVGNSCTLASAYCHLSYEFRHGDAPVFVPISLLPTTEHPSIRNVLSWVFMDQTAHESTPRHIYVLATRDPSVSPSFLTGLYLRRIVGIPISGWKYAVLSGYMPLVFLSNGDDLSSYRIYGTADGAGERTKNIYHLPNNATSNGVTFTRNSADGTVTATGTNPGTPSGSLFYEITNYPDGDYYFSGCPDGGSTTTYNIHLYDTTTSNRAVGWDETTISDRCYSMSQQIPVHLYSSHNYRLTMQVASRYTVDNLVFKPMLRAADTTPDFIPYGYQVPLTVTSGTQTNDIIIPIGDTKLIEGEYISYESTEIIPRGKIHKSGGSEIVVDLPAIETFNGENTLDSTETLGEVTIKGKIKPQS